MSNFIGVHWIPTHRGQEDKERFARWNPAYVKVVCVDERPPYTEDIPSTAKIIIRNHPLSELYGTRGFVRVDEASRAGELAGYACGRMMSYLLNEKGVGPERVVFEGLNEPMLWGGEEPAKTAAYYWKFLDTLHGLGLRGVVGNFGVGWPGNGGVQDNPVQWGFFESVILSMWPGDALGLHEYTALNGPEQNWRWWMGRFLQCPFHVPIIITECGIDTGVTGNYYGGWRDLPESTMDAKAARYVDELLWYGRQCLADGRVKVILPFTYDIGSREWEKFDIRDQMWLNAFFAREQLQAPTTDTTVPPVITPPPVVTPPIDVPGMRNALWGACGIPYNPDAAFPKYARANNLGAPVTGEMRQGGQVFQGFVNGWIYAAEGDWANITTEEW